MTEPYDRITTLNKEELEKIKSCSRCFSDRILGYIEYGFRKRNIEFKSWMKEIYNNLRVDDFFENKNPISVAAGFVYVIAIKEGIVVTQRDLADIYLTTEGSIRKMYDKLRKSKAMLEVFGKPIEYDNTHSIYSQLKGLYTRPDLSNAKFYDVPFSQVRLDCYHCQKHFEHPIYYCKKCKSPIYHLKGILEHYNKKHQRKFKLETWLDSK
jgi:hypothetical protein